MCRPPNTQGPPGRRGKDARRGSAPPPGREPPSPPGRPRARRKTQRRRGPTGMPDIVIACTGLTGRERSIISLPWLMHRAPGNRAGTVCPPATPTLSSLPPHGGNAACCMHRQPLPYRNHRRSSETACSHQGRRISETRRGQVFLPAAGPPTSQDTANDGVPDGIQKQKTIPQAGPEEQRVAGSILQADVPPSGDGHRSAFRFRAAVPD